MRALAVVIFAHVVLRVVYWIRRALWTVDRLFQCEKSHNCIRCRGHSGRCVKMEG